MSDEILNLSEFLERVQNDNELLLELLDIFVEDFGNKRKLLAEAVEKKDHVTLREVAHSLKGAAGNISAISLRESFLKLEDMGKDNVLTNVEDLLNTIDKQFEDLTGHIVTVKEQLSE